MEARPNSDLVKRAEALDARLDETRKFVEKRWQAIETELHRRRRIVEQITQRRITAARRSALVFVLFSLAGAGAAVGAAFLEGGWKTVVVAIVACVAALAALVAAFLFRRSATALEIVVPTTSDPVVMALDAAAQPVAITDVPYLMATSRAVFDRWLRNAEEQGLVERQGDLIALTPTGQARAKQLRTASTARDRNPDSHGQEPPGGPGKAPRT